MPLPSLVCFVFASGLAFALAGRAEIRVSPRPALLTASAGATAAFCTLLVVPVGAFLYVFHGDWFVAYGVDVARVPSAIALVGFVLLIGEGLFAFWVGAALARAQRDAVGGALFTSALVACAAASFVLRHRLQRVGNHAQFTRGFGLRDFGEGALAPTVWTLTAILVIGLVLSTARVFLGRRGVGT